ncbi:MAG: GNAT family N-acetyltransferase [Rhodothermaceae bacterium]|nr:GNAT family N-acetyltransferase [Bacteroidota bacterium]MXW14012.1 GNAT family N-acetyltransferase [Rhodothermaceae bacterium]MCY3629938.1 GNAT family N-acetyltransferase [Bacteroidota bacterium]MDE2645227.1 GNAT family N-acetyltransferase [Bacteroidota bacterium]MXW32506.1 GNAT family N-acetyltransferase [Rhodothermaceae bacterium]
MDQAQTLDALELREGLEGLSPQLIRILYRRAPLRRPVSDPQRLWTMFENASLVVTAWKAGRLVGIARVLTDGVMYSYLCDLAVEPDVQGLGIGKRLMRHVQDRCKGTELVLRSTLGRFHKHEGLKAVEDAWVVDPR